MGNKRVKNYWCKTREKFTNSAKAKERQGNLRNYKSNQVAHVIIERTDGLFYVCYSIANDFKADCERAGIKI